MSLNTTFIAFSLTFIFSCSSFTVTSHVSRFSKIEPYSSKKIKIIPLNSSQKDSLEFSYYKGLVENELMFYNIEIVSKAKKADWILVMDYGMSGSQVEVNSVPIFGTTGGGTTYHSGMFGSFGGGPYNYSGRSYTSPSFGVVGSSTHSKKTYNKFLKIKIIEKRKRRSPASKRKLVPVFEANVKSFGTSPYFKTVSNCLIEAAFKNFPGESSEIFSHKKTHYDDDPICE